MKILWVSNSLHAPTGYGTQTRIVLKGLQRLGHEVANVSFYGVQGARLVVDGITVYPSFRDMWAGDAVAAHASHFGADLCINHHDIWVLPKGYRESFAGLPWGCYFPVDSIPAAPATITRAMEADFPIVYSKFGLEQMKNAGVNCYYVPHAFNPEVFKPGSKEEARTMWGLPQDAFVVGMVAANKGFPSRKAYPECFAAFAEIRKKHKDAILFVHTARSPIGHPNDGIYFGPLIQSLGLEGAPIYFTPEYLQAIGAEEDQVASMYQAMDVLLNPSYAEGFGLTLIEAQACGVPVIVNDVTSMPELVYSGLKIPPIQQYWNLLGCWQFIPSIPAIYDAIDQAYQGNVPRLTDEQVVQVRGDYSIDAVLARYWSPVLREIGNRIAMSRMNKAAD